MAFKFISLLLFAEGSDAGGIGGVTTGAGVLLFGVARFSTVLLVGDDVADSGLSSLGLELGMRVVVVVGIGVGGTDIPIGVAVGSRIASGEAITGALVGFEVVGSRVTAIGEALGSFTGLPVGELLEGGYKGGSDVESVCASSGLGSGVGSFVGSRVGLRVGLPVGLRVGLPVGSFVGRLLGALVGGFVGTFVGPGVGEIVGADDSVELRLGLELGISAGMHMIVSSLVVA